MVSLINYINSENRNLFDGFALQLLISRTASFLSVSLINYINFENRNLFDGFGLPKLQFKNCKIKKLSIERFIFQ